MIFRRGSLARFDQRIAERGGSTQKTTAPSQMRRPVKGREKPEHMSLCQFAERLEYVRTQRLTQHRRSHDLLGCPLNRALLLFRQRPEVNHVEFPRLGQSGLRTGRWRHGKGFRDGRVGRSLSRRTVQGYPILRAALRGIAQSDQLNRGGGYRS